MAKTHSAYEESETLLCLQANKLVCHGLMDTGKKNECTESKIKSWVKDKELLVTKIAIARVSAIVLVPWDPIPTKCSKRG